MTFLTVLVGLVFLVLQMKKGMFEMRKTTIHIAAIVAALTMQMAYADDGYLDTFEPAILTLTAMEPAGETVLIQPLESVPVYLVEISEYSQLYVPLLGGADVTVSVSWQAPVAYRVTAHSPVPAAKTVDRPNTYTVVGGLRFGGRLMYA